ncbi:P-loop containing nucleoside triphosphate hydrolase protein [Zopfochytrium polystomum]|nr:P-loop containing nucleoside triphosphate hydrolase protein [Zopfochytrium polystomum]
MSATSATTGPIAESNPSVSARSSDRPLSTSSLSSSASSASFFSTATTAIVSAGSASTSAQLPSTSLGKSASIARYSIGSEASSSSSNSSADSSRHSTTTYNVAAGPGADNSTESPLDFFHKGTQAWFPDGREGWVLGILQEKTLSASSVRLLFTLEDQDQDLVYEENLGQLLSTNFASLPPLKNPPMLEGIDDLSNLSYLHEPAVLHNVRLRYLHERIYTYSGIVLIAMNPFQRLPLYTPDIMREYSGKKRGELEPHLFAVAEDAYRSMIRDKHDQSIIVSGESGAGKTQSAKYIMRYFALVDNLETKHGVATILSSDSSGVEEAVLSTNPIMEAFGNSKTTRNDNSSRFGKYIQILFTNDATRCRIVGARLRTYLLERSRLVFQPKSERNYHIFYQLCAGVPAAERKELGLGRWSEYHYLNQGGVGTIPGFDDMAELGITQQALSTIGISVAIQWDIFKICAALLHFGNIRITEDKGKAQIADDDYALRQAAKLLELKTADVKKWMLARQLTTRSEKIISALSKYEATVCRDSIAKFIYSTLFDWLVEIVNRNLSQTENTQSTSFIGVLDIYGFEHFQTNSFEQFCINYANEKLQQEFNQHVFKLEQEEYINEKIQWSFIDYYDNQPCIDMIESKLGILDLLDEESRLPAGSDNSLVIKLHQRFGVPACRFYEKPRFSRTTFIVKHYATNVEYEIGGFIDKNKDTITEEQFEVLNRTSFPTLQELIRPHGLSKESSGPTKAAKKKQSLGAIFKASLVQLMSTLRSTDVHYIRCIKPNQAKLPFTFEPQLVLSQLRACGVLETIRISCAGYPSRWTYQEFVDRYYLIIPSNLWHGSPKVVTSHIVQTTMSQTNLYQMGLTKVFFRAGQLAYLEQRRLARIRECVVLIQANGRRLVCRRRYQDMRTAAILIQAYYRRHHARQMYRAECRRRAATRIQSCVRRWIAVRDFLEAKSAALRIQSCYRMYRAMKELRALREERAATTVQRVYRGYLARKSFRRAIRMVVWMQSCIRRKHAIKILKDLRLEAKSVGKLKEKNYNLERKVVELSLTVKSRDEEMRQLNERLAAMESQLARLMRLEATYKSTIAKLSDNSTEQQKELKAANDARAVMSKEMEKLTGMLAKRDAEAAALQSELESAKAAAAGAKPTDAQHQDGQFRWRLDLTSSPSLSSTSTSSLSLTPASASNRAKKRTTGGASSSSPVAGVSLPIAQSATPVGAGDTKVFSAAAPPAPVNGREAPPSIAPIGPNGSLSAAAATTAGVATSSLNSRFSTAIPGAFFVSGSSGGGDTHHPHKAAVYQQQQQVWTPLDLLFARDGTVQRQLRTHSDFVTSLSATVLALLVLSVFRHAQGFLSLLL